MKLSEISEAVSKEVKRNWRNLKWFGKFMVIPPKFSPHPMAEVIESALKDPLTHDIPLSDLEKFETLTGKTSREAGKDWTSTLGLEESPGKSPNRLL